MSCTPSPVAVLTLSRDPNLAYHQGLTEVGSSGNWNSASYYQSKPKQLRQTCSNNSLSCFLCGNCKITAAFCKRHLPWQNYFPNPRGVIKPFLYKVSYQNSFLKISPTFKLNSVSVLLHKQFWRNETHFYNSAYFLHSFVHPCQTQGFPSLCHKDTIKKKRGTPWKKPHSSLTW